MQSGALPVDTQATSSEPEEEGLNLELARVGSIHVTTACLSCAP